MVYENCIPLNKYKVTADTLWRYVGPFFYILRETFGFTENVQWNIMKQLSLAHLVNS